MLPGLPTTRAPVKSVRPLWDDSNRTEGKARLRALYALNDKPVVARKIAEKVREEMVAARNAADTEEARRSQLACWRCVQVLLGLFHAAASLRPPMDPKTRKRPRFGRGQSIWDLELSAEEIGDLIGYKRSTVYAALRWLPDYVRNVPRIGPAILTREDGKEEARPLKRTSVRYLSAKGLATLGLEDGPRLVHVVMREAAAKMKAPQLSLFEVPDTDEERARAQAAVRALAQKLGCAEEFALYRLGQSVPQHATGP